MTDTESMEEPDYYVVVNHEEQYSVWRADLTIPGGWTTVGEAASRESCLDWIEENWQDLRPLSLRQALSGSEAQR